MRYELYCGMDLSSRDAQLAWRDAEGKVVRQQRIRLRREIVQGVLKEQAGKGIVGCEAMENAFVVHDWLSEIGVELRIAPPRKLKIIFETCFKTDRIDARKLSYLLWKDMYPWVWIPPITLRRLRELPRHRARLVRTHTQWVLRNQSLHRRWGQEELPTEAAWVEQNTGELLGFVKEQVEKTEKAASWALKDFPELKARVKQLQTAPGIGKVTSTALVLELGDMQRFKHVKSLYRLCRLVPGVKESGAMHRDRGIAKDARKDLQWLLIEAAWTAVRHTPYFREKHGRLVQRGLKPSQAIFAVARSLLNAIYLMWTRNCTYPELVQARAA